VTKHQRNQWIREIRQLLETYREFLDINLNINNKNNNNPNNSLNNNSNNNNNNN